VQERKNEKDERLRNNYGRKVPNFTYHGATTTKIFILTLRVQYFIERCAVAIEIVGGFDARLKKKVKLKNFFSLNCHKHNGLVPVFL
jgi:hypothetical protein